VRTSAHRLTSLQRFTDQIVRTDLKELVDLNLEGRVYGYAPMGDDRADMEGFRFWKTGKHVILRFFACSSPSLYQVIGTKVYGAVPTISGEPEAV
jgi:hypothetical protein